MALKRERETEGRRRKSAGALVFTLENVCFLRICVLHCGFDFVNKHAYYVLCLCCMDGVSSALCLFGILPYLAKQNGVAALRQQLLRCYTLYGIAMCGVLCARQPMRYQMPLVFFATNLNLTCIEQTTSNNLRNMLQIWLQFILCKPKTITISLSYGRDKTDNGSR